MKKLLSVFLLLTLLITSFFPLAASAKAAGDTTQTWFDQNYFDWYLKVYDDSSTPATEIFGERYTAAQVEWIMFSLPAITMNKMLGSRKLGVCAIGLYSHGDITKLKECFEGLSDIIGITLSPNVNNKENSASIIEIISNQPLSGIGYLKNKIEKFSIVKTTYAQSSGFGYNAGQSIQKIWVSVRNVAYGLIVLVAIYLSFMVMFRMKINPQTMVTVQNAIPKLILIILGVTFSYAIAGLMIDLMYVVIALIAGVISGAGLVDYPGTNNTIELFKDFVTKEGFVLAWQYLISWIVASIMTFTLGLGTLSIGGVLGGVLAIFFTIILFFVILINSFKILFMLIKTYINVILNIVMGPIQILMGVFSKNAGFTSWIRSLISNLAVFPVTGILFFGAFFFLAQTMNVLGWTSISNLFTPFAIEGDFFSDTTSWNPPLTFGQGNTNILMLLISYTIFVSIPKAAEAAKAMIEGGKFDTSSNIGVGVAKSGFDIGSSVIGYGVGKAEQDVKRAGTNPSTLLPAMGVLANRKAAKDSVDFIRSLFGR